MLRFGIRIREAFQEGFKGFRGGMLGAEQLLSARALHRTVRIVFVSFTVLYLVLLGVNSLGYEGKFSPDSVYYIDTARNIVAGRGISNSMAPLRGAVEMGQTLPRPMTMWGPLYPLLISFSSRAGLPAPAGALLVPIVFLGIILCGSYLLLRELFDDTVGLLGVAFLLHFAPLRLISIHAWSDSVGLAFEVLLFYIILRSCRAEGSRAGLYAVLGGLAAGMAFAARYALLPLLPMSMLLLVERKRPREAARKLGFLVIGFVVVAAPVFIRNLVLTGHFRGARALHGWGVPFGKAFSDLLRVIAETAAPGSWLVRLIYVFLVAIGAAMCVVGIRRRTLLSTLRDTISGGKRYLLLVWPAGYLAFLLYCETRMPIDPINARLTVPATLLLMLLLAAVLVRIVAAGPWLFTSASLVLAVLAAGNEVPTTSAVIRTNLPPAYEFQHKLAHSETLVWLSNNVTDRDLIVAEDGLDLPLYLGSVKTLYFLSVWPPTSQISRADFTHYMERHREEYEHVYLVLQKDFGRRTLDIAQEGWFLAGLAADPLNPGPGVTVKMDLKDGLIYEIDGVR